MVPVMIFDGECEFCRKWIRRFEKMIHAQVDYIAYQDLADRFPEIPRADFERAVHWVDSQGQVSSGAEAVLRALALNPGYRWTFWAYQRLPGMRWLCDRGYDWVAKNRALISRIVRF
jgi:predicted DCC family thiol-disulfide oxidoreductase YuxK